MSWLSKYFFDPVKAALERQSTSANPISAAAGVAATAAIQNVVAVASTSINVAVSTKSAAGLANPVIGALEDGLKSVIDAALIAGLGEIPIVGAMVTPGAVALTNTTLTLMEQHAATYLASLFHHAKAQVPAATATVASQVASQG